MKVKFPDWWPTAILILVPATISVVVGVTFAIQGRQVSQAETELLSKGSRAIGTVIEKTTAWDDEGDTYMVRYTFSAPNGEQLTAGWAINEPAWDKLDIGSQIEIAFDPAHPSRNLPVEAETTPLWFAPLPAVVFAFLSFVVSFFLLLLVMTLIERLVTKLVPFNKKGTS